MSVKYKSFYSTSLFLTSRTNCIKLKRRVRYDSVTSFCGTLFIKTFGLSRVLMACKFLLALTCNRKSIPGSYSKRYKFSLFDSVNVGREMGRNTQRRGGTYKRVLK
jgi:hypothetical protein